MHVENHVPNSKNGMNITKVFFYFIIYLFNTFQNSYKEFLNWFCLSICLFLRALTHVKICRITMKSIYVIQIYSGMFVFFLSNNCCKYFFSCEKRFKMKLIFSLLFVGYKFHSSYARWNNRQEMHSHLLIEIDVQCNWAMLLLNELNFAYYLLYNKFIDHRQAAQTIQIFSRLFL